MADALGSLTAKKAAGGSSDLSLLRSAVDQTSNLQAQAVENAAAAAASGVTASGDLTESQAYGTAKEIAERNAALEGIAGDIVNVQQQRQVRSTIGSQRAAVSSAGFASSGSSLDLLRSSLQQGYLTQQLNQVQTQISQGGFLEAGVASEVERVAAERASQAALVLQQQQAAAGERAAANAAAETAAIQSYLTAKGASDDPLEAAKQAVVTATLRNTDGSAAVLPKEATPEAVPEDQFGRRAAPVFDAYGRAQPGVTGVQVVVQGG